MLAASAVLPFYGSTARLREDRDAISMAWIRLSHLSEHAMSKPTTPARPRTGTNQPPDPEFALHFSRRLWQSGLSLDRATGFVDALGDVLSQVSREYGDRLASRVHVASYVSEELRTLGEELQGMQRSFLAWYRETEGRRRAEERQETQRREAARRRAAKRREQRRKKKRGSK